MDNHKLIHRKRRSRDCNSKTKEENFSPSPFVEPWSPVTKANVLPMSYDDFNKN